LDIHREQITFDYLDDGSGEIERGRISPATRTVVRKWLGEIDARPASFALEGCTGWRFVVEELQSAGMEAHLAEPADTAALRGPKRRAKTDRLDAQLMRTALVAGMLPESWIPPTHVLETRATVRLYKALIDDRTAWQQRMHATLFHQGVAAGRGLLGAEQRRMLETTTELSPAGRRCIDMGLYMVDAIDARLLPLRRELEAFARRQPGCRTLQSSQFGVGWLTSVAIWAELGDCRRFGSSRQAVRHTGLDVTVHDSDGKRTSGHLARQGPELLRWALFEAAKCAARAAAPDHDYYCAVRKRKGANRATLSVARKIVRRCHHTLVALGDQALAPVD